MENNLDTDASMDPERMKAVIDLRHYIETVLGADRPKIGAMFKELGINPHTASDMIRTATHATMCTVEPIALSIVNDMFKLGVVIGYKYAVAKQMKDSFNLSDLDPNFGDTGDE